MNIYDAESDLDYPDSWVLLTISSDCEIYELLNLFKYKMVDITRKCARIVRYTD